MDIILYLLIGLWFMWIDEKYFAIGSSEVYINGNITAEAYSNDIRLKCSFSLGEGDVFYAIALTAENSSTASFNEIAGYLQNPLFTPFGMDLFGNESSIHFEETTKSFMLSFNNLTCRHERRYKCLLYVATKGSAKIIEFESDTMWISVTVLPLIPEMTLPTKVNDLSGGTRNKRSATIMPENDTHKQDFIEGDNITFMCAGDVGRPEGSFEWQKIYANDEKHTYSNTFTETIPESCSYDGNSTLTMQVTGDDNQAIIRCIVKSRVSDVSVYEDSEPLRIQFQVRIPVIELQPDKTVFLEGDSVQLKCQSQGNPSPSYSWLKGNESNQTIIAYTDSFVIENVNITDSGLYTCSTNNSIDGIDHKEFNSTYIIIAKQSTRPSTSTLSPLGVDITKDILIAVISAGVVVFVTVILFLIVVCIHKKRKTSSAKFSEYGLKMTNTKKNNNENNDTDNEVEQQQKETDRRRTKDAHSRDNPQNEDTYADAPDGVYDKPGDRRHIEEKNREPFDHVDTAKNTSLHRKNKETDKEFNDQQQKGTYVYVETEIRRTKDTYSRDNPQNEDTYADAPDGVYDKPGDRRHIEEKNCESFDHVDTAKNISNENSDEETESTVTTSDHIMGRVNPAFENDDVSDKDGTIKGVMASPTMRMAGPPIEHTQIETTNATEDDADDDDDNYCNAIHNSKLLTSVRDTKQIENINTEIQEGIDKRPCRTVDNAGYFDTTRHVESLTSSEHTRQNENINAKTQEGIEEIPGRVIDNAVYFDTTLRLMDQQTNGGQITAKRDDQTKTYTNQAFETEEDQLADEVSSQFRLLDGLQDGGERNQNVD